MDEMEILRGAKVRVTTHRVIVDDDITSIDDIGETAFVEADHRIRFLPLFLFVLGPTVGALFYLTVGWPVRSLLAALGIMALGALVYRNSWLHEVNARLVTGLSTTLYRTRRKGDALLFHAAIGKAMELRAEAGLAAQPGQTPMSNS